MSPEKQSIGLREKFIRATSLAALAIASVTSSGCSEPTRTPNPTDPNKPIATETFTPTETATPTEIALPSYQADVVDVTALHEAQPTADNPLTKVYDDWLAQAKEIPNLPDPRIWALQIKTNGTLTENVVLAQSQYTHDTYILNIVSGEGDSTQSTRINSQMFARAVVGAGGAYQNIEYYYKDQTGGKSDVLTFDQLSGKFFYTTLNGQKEEIPGFGIYFGKTEDPATGGKLLSLVPPGENFYKTLPEGAVVNTETGQTTDSSGVLIYKDENGKWLSTAPTETPVPIPFENGPSLEFSPLFPAEWHKEWTGNVKLADGSTLSIPVFVGLASDLIHNPDPNGKILGVWMKQEGADAWADAFLRASHHRYMVDMGHKDTSYDKYLECLNQPTGCEISVGILDNDGKTMRVAMIDPRQGFSILLTVAKNMPVATIGERGDFFGVDGKGRLLLASNDAIDYPRTKKYELFGVDITDYDFLNTNISNLLYFGAYDNECLLARRCSYMTIDPGAKLSFDWTQIMNNILKNQIQDQKLDLIYGLVTP